MMRHPYLDDGLRGFIYNMAKKNCNKIAGYDFDDIVQEGFVCFFKCTQRYIGKAGWKGGENTTGYVNVPLTDRQGAEHKFRFLPEDNPDKLARRHFASLFQRAFNNRLIDLRAKYPAMAEVAIGDMVQENQTTDQVWDSILPSVDEIATTSVMLANAPNEIKQLMVLLVNDALELSGYKRLGKRRRRAPRETTNQRFCRLLGLPDYDIVGAVNRYFLRS